jgi:hypothetical protein
MPMSDVIAFGAGRDIPLDHLGPHNALEWVIYLGLIAIFAAVVVHEWRNRNALPGFRAPRRRKTRPDPAARPMSESPAVGSDERSADPAQDPEQP